MTDLQDALDIEMVLAIEAAIYNHHPELVQPYLDTVEAARKVANPNIEAAIPHLLNFREWVKGTDEITDHDLLLTAKWIVTAALGIDSED